MSLRRCMRLVTREIGRFRTSDGVPLTAIAQRLAAIDARDGRAAAATGDVDVMYRVGDQLRVQPDARLAACFSEDEPVRMTRPNSRKVKDNWFLRLAVPNLRIRVDGLRRPGSVAKFVTSTRY